MLKIPDVTLLILADIDIPDAVYAINKSCEEIECGWPLCPDGAIPKTQLGDCCPSCPGKRSFTAE